MQLFNTQTGQIERFTPRDGTVGLYVCGVTPYDTTHIGHAFTFLTFDILVRLMRHKGWDVTYVQNVTDIDDDILRKAKEVGLTWKELGDREIARYLKDMRDLNALAPDHYVRATDHIPEMLEIIQSLIDKGNAYESNGNVYFSVNSDPEFGKLSHIPREQHAAHRQRAGQHARRSAQARSARLRALAGVGGRRARLGLALRPGTAGMARRVLGDGQPLSGTEHRHPRRRRRPHLPPPRGEVAQSENAFGVEPFARIWIHAAHGRLQRREDEQVARQSRPRQRRC